MASKLNSRSQPRPFVNIANFRDVGESINDFVGSEVVQVGKLYRSARPGFATTEDRQLLVEKYGVKQVIDLRSKTELIQEAQRKNAPVPSSALVPQGKAEVAEAASQISGISYSFVDLNGSAFAHKLISQLSWYDYGRLILYYCTGYRLDAIKILGSNVMQHRGLIGLGHDTLDASGKEILEIFQILADAEKLPVLLHCTQGKDRTGLAVALVLYTLAVPIEAVKNDYLKSESELKPELESRLRELRSVGLNEEFSVCPPSLIGELHKHIVTKYGSVEAYLSGEGVTPEMQEKVKSNLGVSKLT